ncbi:MAG: hypothetical protein H0U64_13050 [Gemmatimonadaceae bacterium]|nr:hypothetical protein [Gemmatimonadaceae bacterium]
MNKLALALAFSAVGATAASAQIVNLNTGASISTNRTQDGSWRREGNTDIYTRRRIDANGNRVIDRARRDALGNFIVIDSRIVSRNDNRGHTDNTWKNSDNEHRVYVRTRTDANGNRILEKARRDSNGNFVVFDSRVLGRANDRDRDNDGISDDREDGKSKDGKWKKDKDGKKWNKAVNKANKSNNGKAKGKNK